MAHTTGVTASIQEILRCAHHYSFVQVLRILRKYLDPQGEKGLPGIPWEDRVAVRPHLSLGFPASDVVRVEKTGDNFRVTTTFLGLYGTSSPLPTFYTEDLLDEASRDESSFRDLLDIIHKRLSDLYLRVHGKYRLALRVVEQNNHTDIQRLLCLIGLGEQELASTIDSPCALLPYLGLLTQYPRSASGLKTLLENRLKENITIVRNVKRKVKIPQNQRMRLGVSCCRLGIDTVLGSEQADIMGKIRIKIGPLTWEQYNRYLPGETPRQELEKLVRHYLTDPLEVELELVLAAGEAKPLRLGDPASRLGLNTWCFSGETLGETSARFPVADQPFTPASPEKSRPTRQTSRTLVDHYNEERAYLRELTARYVAEHPNMGPLMGGGPTGDPGVERLMEGVAFYNALLRRKLDDDIPEIIHEVIGGIQPDSLCPLPAATIVAFAPKKELSQPLTISSGAEVVSIPVAGAKCRFRTCCDLTVHPLMLLNALFSHESGKAPCIALQCELNGIGFSAWKPGSLRLYLGDDYPAASDLYLLLMRYLRCITVISRDNGATVEISPACLKPVDFVHKESVSAKEKDCLPGYRMLQDFFLFHDMFFFIDLCGLERCASLGDVSRFEIRFELVDSLPFTPRVNEKSFVFFAVPVINLFPHKAKPITSETDFQRLLLLPEGKMSSPFQIYSVDRIVGLIKKNSAKVVYNLRGSSFQRTDDAPVCCIKREASVLEDGFQTFLSIPDYENEAPALRIKFDIDLTCTNGILPEQLGIGDISEAGPNIPASVCPENIKGVSAGVVPEFRENGHWRLLSGLSLNQLSLISAANFRAILRVFIAAFDRPRADVMENMKKIDAIEGVEAKATDRLIGRYIYRGYDVRLKLRGDCFAGPGDLYLFSSVLERFLGGYVTCHCFTRLIVEEIDNGYRFEWPARLGDRSVL